ncbi:MAG: hypothetical protein WBP54_04030 [Pelodictyon phaeoclathratiforme]
MHLQTLRDNIDTLVMDADVLESLLESREPTVIYFFADVGDGGTVVYSMAVR